MPESVIDRPTSSHEKIYLLTKASRYFYDAEAVREPELVPGASAKQIEYQQKNRKDAPDKGFMTNDSRGTWRGDGNYQGGRNLRNVWTIPTQPFPESHYATFPLELPRKCILAGTSERGVCEQCGKPWIRSVEIVEHAGHKPRLDETNFECAPGPHPSSIKKETGWKPSCDCNAPTIPATVLDPFARACTTLLVALQLNRRAIGIELNPAYCEMGLRRIEAEARQEKLF
jgi:hypothetical protein